jgi:hypothetical protein
MNLISLIVNASTDEDLDDETKYLYNRIQGESIIRDIEYKIYNI